jgi:Ca2+/Na+ antiporter
MSYLPLTNNVGVNLALSSAMDSNNSPAASQQTQPQVIIVQAPAGTTIQVVQPPHQLPLPEEKPLSTDFTVFIFMMGVTGVLLIVLAATRKASLRKLIGAIIVIPWALFACYNLFSLARAG